MSLTSMPNTLNADCWALDKGAKAATADSAPAPRTAASNGANASAIKRPTWACTAWGSTPLIFSPNAWDALRNCWTSKAKELAPWEAFFASLMALSARARASRALCSARDATAWTASLTWAGAATLAPALSMSERVKAWASNPLSNQPKTSLAFAPTTGLLFKALYALMRVDRGRD